MIKVNDINVELKGTDKEIITDFSILIRRLINILGKKEYDRIYNFILNEIEEFEREMNENTTIKIHEIKGTNKNEILKQLEDLHAPDFVKKIYYFAIGGVKYNE